MARIVAIAGMLAGGIGLFLGFYYLSTDTGLALEIVTLTTVGVVGLLAFVRHVIFHRSDAARLGWEAERPDWMFEVGFANLAFAVMGFVAVLAVPGSLTQGVVLLGYALYLLQAAALHAYRYFTDETRSPARLWRSCIATLLFAGMMLIFAFKAIPR